MAARDLLHRLLDYIGEPAKDIDPRGYRLGTTKGFIRRREALAGLPGVEFDLKVAGDHTWLRVARLDAKAPPPLSDAQRGRFASARTPTARRRRLTRLLSSIG